MCEVIHDHVLTLDRCSCCCCACVHIHISVCHVHVLDANGPQIDGLVIAITMHAHAYEGIYGWGRDRPFRSEQLQIDVPFTAVIHVPIWLCDTCPYMVVWYMSLYGCVTHVPIWLCNNESLVVTQIHIDSLYIVALVIHVCVCAYLKCISVWMNVCMRDWTCECMGTCVCT